MSSNKETQKQIKARLTEEAQKQERQERQDIKPLLTPLSVRDIDSGSYRDFMEKLKAARAKEAARTNDLKTDDSSGSKDK